MTARLLAGVLLGLWTAPALAQVDAELHVGGIWSSALVHDSIVNSITIRPAIAPQISVDVGTALSPQYRVSVRMQWARSNLQRSEAGETTTVVPLTVWTGAVVLGRRLSSVFGAEARAGAIKYAPGGDSREGTLFQDDAPLVAAAGLGVLADWQVGARWSAGIRAGYDLHQFHTQALRSAGFSGPRFVHRIALSASIRWSVGDAATH